MISLIEAGGPEQVEAQLVATIREIGIPPRPLILEQVTAEVAKAQPDFKRLAAVIGADVSIAASMIKLVNSPFYGFRRKVHTVQDAVVLLGLDAIATTLASVVLRNLLPAGPKLERFWDASARIAQLSGWLAQELGQKDQVRFDQAYTYGLFRDCGIPIMLRRFPGYLETLALANQDTEQAFTEVEETYHPTNHALIGGILAQSWWLSEDTCMSIRHHHDYVTFRSGAGALTPTARRLVALTQLAEYLVQQTTQMCQSAEWQKMGTSCLQILRLSQQDLADLCEAALQLEQSGQMGLGG